jgi:acetylornithine deacetylase
MRAVPPPDLDQAAALMRSMDTPAPPLSLSADERRVLDAIDVDALVGQLCEIVSIPSLGGEETPAQEWMAAQMASLGMDMDVWEIDLPELSKDPAFSTEIERSHALGVVGSFGGGEGRTLVLNGHVDVVPVGELERWSSPPWQGTVREGRVYGRGAVDMKGGLCCALAAVRALRNAAVEVPGRVLVQSVIGEEDGGAGTLAAVRRGHTGDGAIVLEPTRLVLAPAQAGALNFRVTIPGRAAHGALRAEGVSPLEKFVPVFNALLALEARRNSRSTHPLFHGTTLPYPICVGTLHSGIWASTVPESLTFEGRLGVAVDEAPEHARLALAETLAAVTRADPWLREHPPLLEWWGGQFHPAATPIEHPIVSAVFDAHESITGAAPSLQGMPYGADMRLLVHEGATPTVLYGPGDVRTAHAPDEFVPIAELETVARVLALAILRFCR